MINLLKSSLQYMNDVRHWINTFSVDQTMQQLSEVCLPREMCQDIESLDGKEIAMRINFANKAAIHGDGGDNILLEIYDIYDHFDEYLYIHDDVFIDELSRFTLRNILFYRLTRLPLYLYRAYSPSSVQYYDPTIVSYSDNCVFVDCGALNGETSLEFTLRFPNYKRVYVYEPIQEYYQECISNLKNCGSDKIIIRNAAVEGNNGNIHFSNNIRASGRIDEKGDIIVPCVSLDSDIVEKVEFIKMDIEGSELSAIKGAMRHISEEQPVLAICVYHKPTDIRDILALVSSYNKCYRFYLRHHTPFVFETVLYAIPMHLAIETNQNSHSTLPSLTESQLLLNIHSLREINEKTNWLYAMMRDQDELIDLREELRFLRLQVIDHKQAHEFFKRQCDALVEKVDYLRAIHQPR